MNLVVSFKNMEKCDILNKKADLKINKIINKYVNQAVQVALTFSFDHKVYIASLDFKLGIQRPFSLKAESYSNLTNLDKICDKLEKKLRRLKSKKHKIMVNGSRDVSAVKFCQNEETYDSIDADEILNEKIRREEQNVEELKCI